MSVGRSGPFVVDRAVLHRNRWLPSTGEVLLELGDRADHDTIVARSPGRGLMHAVNAARLLDIPPTEVPKALLHPIGSFVAMGEPLARTRGLWGMFATVCRAPVNGTVAAVSPHTGRILMEEPGAPLEISAFLPGVVTKIDHERGVRITGWAARVAGVFGVGGEASGPLRTAVGRPETVLDAAQLGPEVQGSVLIGGALVTGAALRRAAELGAVGLVTGGVHDRDLAEFVGRQVVLADTTGMTVDMTIVVLGGFGRWPMSRDAFQLLNRYTGMRSCLVGTTRVRAGAQRPEIIIPLQEQAAADRSAGSCPLDLCIGCRVLVVRNPWFGMEGRVARLPDEPRAVQSEARCLVAEVDLDCERTVLVPRANLEILRGPSEVGNA
jgi:hypothetical protein